MGDAVRWLNEREQHTWRSFVAATGRLMDRLDADMRRHTDIDLADYEILVLLSESEGCRMRMSDLAAAANVSRSRLTHRVNSLEAKRLVARVPCPQDRRGFYAVLTPQGQACLESAAPHHVRAVRRYFSDAVDSGDVAGFDSALAGILESLEH